MREVIRHVKKESNGMKTILWVVLLAISLSLGLLRSQQACARDCCGRHGGLDRCDEQTGFYRCKDGYLTECPCKPVSPVRWAGRLVRAIDCRSLEFDRNGRLQSVGLYGVICPDRIEELQQMGMRLVREFASEGSVEIEPVAVDKHGRESVWLFSGETCLNIELVRRGLANWDRSQAPTHRDLSQAEFEASGKLLGIWSKGSGAVDR
jgi:endonuclease YncB( thermonuclease family)